MNGISEKLWGIIETIVRGIFGVIFKLIKMEPTEEQWDAIDRGIAFYHKIAPVIKNGISFRFGPKIKSARHPKGWQAVLRVGKDGEAYAVFHTFDGELPEAIEIPLPKGCPESMAEVYAAEVYTAADLRIEGRMLRWRPKENWEAVAVRLGGGGEPGSLPGGCV